ncbi:hypothetical protein [Rhizobium leguminosarum]|uniref:hypothetical protein n=1 Tax=Rhizobium TaxID=379 RepID=UPI00103FE6CE|nr:hypothetical protein [Rhizobium leguminosarum]TCA72254.1 hypothetical protein E0H69_18560 [Rhizobium leguminosarum bv. viciae]
MTRSLFSGLVFLSLAIGPAKADSILDAAAPADALKVEFVAPDTTPTDRLEVGKLLTVDVVVTRSTGVVRIDPTVKPDWMTYDTATHQFSGVPVAGHHELVVRAIDAVTGQTATGILDFDIEAR